MALRLALLGPPTVDADAASTALPFERRGQLVAFLAMRRAWVGRAELASMLWPEQADRLAYANLRKTLFRLQSLPWGAAVEAQASALRCDVATDVVEFESAIRDRRLGDALRLRRGEFLAGFDDDTSEAWSSWLAFERDRLRLAWRGAALEHLASGIDEVEAIELSARLLETDPLDEAALRAYMSALARSGHGARASAAYRDFAQRLADELGLAPGGELARFHDSLGARATPTARTVPASPPPTDGFVGRTIELRRLVAMLARDGARLVSIVGPGGVGKTRLAERAMHEVAANFAHGAIFVALENAATARDAMTSILRELRADVRGRADPLDQAIEHLRERELLLVLDNFEQLAGEAAAMLEALLAGCPRLRVVVASRVRLAVRGEELVRLEGMPCPEPEDADEAEAFDAVRLFMQAAARVDASIAPAIDATAIADICRQVGGLPLAIELAAAWTRVIGCEAIAAELREGTGLLHDERASPGARHASIDVVFEQSWRLLTAIEREALARLSLFRGGFSPEAARAIAGASLPVLGALADKSLVRRDGERLFLHPLVGRLASSRLDGEAREAAARAHAAWFHRLLEQLRRAIDDGDRDALSRLDVEFENCRIAWRWAATHAALDMMRSSVHALMHYCDHRSRVEEGLALLLEALASSGSDAASSSTAAVLASAAHLQYRLDRYDEAYANAERALAAASRDLATRLQCFKVLGSCSLRRGHLADAQRFFRQALAAAPASVDPHNAAGMLDNLALVEKRMGHYDESLRLSLQSLVAHRRLRDVAGEALCLNNLGALHHDRGEHATAAAHLREALALCELHRLVGTRLLVDANLSEVEMNLGDLAAAQRHAARAVEAAQAAANRPVEAAVKLVIARLALRRGDRVAARSGLADALEIAVALGRPALKLAGVRCFADVLEADGEALCAMQLLAYVADHPATQAIERSDLLARIGKLQGGGRAASPMRLELDALVHRIVVERDLAHRPLIAALRGST